MGKSNDKNLPTEPATGCEHPVSGSSRLGPEQFDASNDGGVEPSAHELDAPPWLRVESTLMATARLIRRAYDMELGVLDLNLTSASLLMYVAERGGTTQTVLAQRLDVGRAAAGLVVDRLEKRGLVARRADVEDRRTWVVVTTSDGRKLAKEVAAIDETVRGRLRHGVSRQSRQELAQLLLQMQQNLLDPPEEG